jgi:hypothetical protein
MLYTDCFTLGIKKIAFSRRTSINSTVRITKMISLLNTKKKTERDSDKDE